MSDHQEAYESKTSVSVQDILNIEKDLAAISQKHNRDHATSSGVKDAKEALSFIAGVLDKVVGVDADIEIKDYFAGKTKIANKEVSLDTLLHLSYACNIWSTEDMYRSHNGIMSREKINIVEQMMQNYLNNNGVEIDLAELDTKNVSDEMLHNLSKFKHVLEMYTASTYLKGRTYIYENDYESAMPHFELARRLSENTSIFEHHLSQRNGICIVNDRRIELALKDGKKEEAKEIIESNIAIYNNLLNSHTHYKMDYSPTDTDKNYKDCVPKSDPINVAECSKRLIKYHAWNIGIIENKEEADRALKLFEGLIQGNEDHCSIIDVLENKMDDSMHLSNKIRAFCYNDLGKALMKVAGHDKIDMHDLCNFMADKLAINIHKDDGKLSISLIKFIFNKALKLSGNTEFTRADSENGLAEIELFEISNLSQQEKNNLTSKALHKAIQSVEDHLRTRDEINNSLTRKTVYSDEEINAQLNKLKNMLVTTAEDQHQDVEGFLLVADHSNDEPKKDLAGVDADAEVVE